MDKLIDGLGRIADNVWAFVLFALAAALAIVAHVGKDSELLHFATSVALTGAALFHGKDTGKAA